MELKERVTACFLILFLWLAAMPVAGSQDGEHEANVIQADGFEEFVDAAALAASEEGEDSVSEAGEEGPGQLWQSRRLLVKGGPNLDPFGAKRVIQGYGGLIILDYETQEQTKLAYDSLCALGVSVEVDSVYEVSGQTAKPHNQLTSADPKKGEGSRAPISLEEPAGAVTPDGPKRLGREMTVPDPAAKERNPSLFPPAGEGNAMTKPKGALVAVLDTGYTGNEKTGRIVDPVDLTASGSALDENGHGSAMANLILENTSEGVSVMPVKIADANGKTSSLRLYMGIQYAIEHGADVIGISMSAYLASNSMVVDEAVREARERGIFVVVSAGNLGKDVSDFSPANAKGAIAASAVQADGSFARYSNFGSAIGYCSYGKVWTHGADGKWTAPEGTSVAAAVVAAAIAEEKARQPLASYEEALLAIDRNVKDLGEAGRDDYYGKGLLTLPNVQAAGEEDGRQPEILTCDWRQMPVEEFNTVVGNASNLERRVFLAQLNEAEKEELLSKKTLFSEEVLYLEHSFDGEKTEDETFRMEGRLYDIVMSGPVSDEYEAQQKYHVFHYGKKDVSHIALDTAYNTKKAKIYCWMKQTDSDKENSGEYGILFRKGESAYQFLNCTSKIEDTDAPWDGTGNRVWRINVKQVSVEKPKDAAVLYDGELWKETGKLDGHDVKEHYWYIWNHQVKPASDARRQEAYGKGSNMVGSWHGGFWDLGNSDRTSGKKCGSGAVVTTVDIGSRDLAVDGKEGITYRLPLVTHKNTARKETVVDAKASCLKAGSSHVKTTYQCEACGTSWSKKGAATELARLAHDYKEKKAEDNAIANGKRWMECARDCEGTDVNGEFWQKDVQYLQPVRYWEMDENGNYPSDPSGTERETVYYAQGNMVPAWSRTPSKEHLTGRLAQFAAPGGASYHDVKVARKQYTVAYDGNGATSGEMEPQSVYFGQAFDLRENGFARIGYRFCGFSASKNGNAIETEGVKNLAAAHGDTVTLYALWEAEAICVTLDHQGANRFPGTGQFYERYADGYYQDRELSKRFQNGKIELPVKEREDGALAGGVRRQKFLGYYTKRNGAGDQVIQSDGSMVSNINGMGSYRYFLADTTVYADWEDMKEVRFSPNLTEEDEALLGTEGGGPVRCPSARWIAKGEGVTLSYEGASVRNELFSDVYRFLGWSLTPEIETEEEIVLSEEKRGCQLSGEDDVTLYAQWDTGFRVAYMGNGQTAGDDRIDEAERLTDRYAFLENDSEADGFVKEVQKQAVDPNTGLLDEKAEHPYQKAVPCRFMGYSLAKEPNWQRKMDVYAAQEEEMPGSKLLLAAKKAAKEGAGAGLTFGGPEPFYAGIQEEGAGKDDPFVNLYAVWDQFPEIFAADLYLPLKDAQQGAVTEEYLLQLAVAADEELKSDTNQEGRMKAGKDEKLGTSFTIPDFQQEDFTKAEEEMSLTITYQAKDQAGSVTEETVRVFLVDTSQKSYDAGTVRFISEEYLDTLKENSIWRTGAFARKLKTALSNQKAGEEYTAVTPLQKALGVKPVRKAGSGAWDHVQEVWEFSHEELAKIQAHIKETGVGKDPSGFLNAFGHCRK